MPSGWPRPKHILVITGISPTRVHHNVTWIQPIYGVIKIFVDGFFNTNINGVGGIFCDHTLSILLYFVKTDNAKLAIHTKILAIRKSYLIVPTSRWSLTMDFIIKSYSVNTVSWFNDPSKSPWNFQNLMRESLSQFSMHIRQSIIHVRRSSNEVANFHVRVGAHDSCFIN